MIKTGKARQDRLVGNGRVVEGDGAGKEPIAGNPWAYAETATGAAPKQSPHAELTFFASSPREAKIYRKRARDVHVCIAQADFAMFALRRLYPHRFQKGNNRLT